MTISEDHFYHGAALIQIAEYEQFTAINAAKYQDKASRSSYIINQDIALYLKYATKPNSFNAEYAFTFNENNRNELDELHNQGKQVFLGLVCVDEREICCISHSQFNRLILKRQRKKRESESVYSILVTAPEGTNFRVYVNDPIVKGQSLGQILIPRNRFPKCLFFA